MDWQLGELEEQRSSESLRGLLRQNAVGAGAIDQLSQSFAPLRFRSVLSYFWWMYACLCEQH